MTQEKPLSSSGSNRHESAIKQREIAIGVTLATLALIEGETPPPISTRGLTDFVSYVSGVGTATTRAAILYAREDRRIEPPSDTLAALGVVNQSNRSAVEVSQADPVKILGERAVTREELSGLLDEQLALDAATFALQERFRSLHER